MRTETVTGFYGSQKTKTDIFVYRERNGGAWYVCDGGSVVNFTYDEIENGVNVEELKDVDCFTSSVVIESEEQLRVLIED